MQKSIDDSSVWWVYERNSNYYHICKDISNCPNTFQRNLCYCHRHALVKPIIIGECGFWCDDKIGLNHKSYIKWGEICPICTDPIIYKRNAWITPCGHGFHRNCLVDNHRYRQINKMTIEYTNSIPCPMCREGLIECCIGLADINRYGDEFEDDEDDNKKNLLDRLEDFWLNIDRSYYYLCYDCDKGLGMNNSCKTCVNYQKTGNFCIY